MNSMETLTTFLGWCTAINSAMLLFASVMLVLTRGGLSKIHGKMFGLGDEDISRAYFQYLAHYKIAIIVFNFVPYVALKIMA